MKLYPTTHETEQILARFRDSHIGVLGDFCVDAYWILDETVQEISLETGKAVQHVREQRYSPGGAGNVVVNLCALGVGHVSVFGVIGNDLFGRELASTFRQMGVDTDGLLIQPEHWDTPVYGKPLIGVTEQQRLDFGAFNRIAGETWTGLQEYIKGAADSLDFLIVNQQLPSGWCDSEKAAWLRIFLETQYRGRHLIDTRHFVDNFVGLSMKVNQYEAANLINAANLDDMLDGCTTGEMDARLIPHVVEPLFITRGDRGMAMFHQSTCIEIPGILLAGPTDPVGAGDTVTATLAACRSAGVEPGLSALLANLAASITVGKINQTGTAGPGEILSAVTQLAYLYHPRVAEEPRLAQHIAGTEVEIVENYSIRDISAAVFDHDGTISTLRQGWERVMEPMMIQAILGDQVRTVSSELYAQVQERVRNYIEYSTGIQTIAQMDALVQMVDEFDVVPQAARLDAWGYKNLYNQALMTMVNERIRRLRCGEFDCSDFIMKGAVHFLTALKAVGVQLSLVSGTDEEDAIREAEILGYSGLFDGGIHGAKTGSRVDTKEGIIKSLLDSMSEGKELASSADSTLLVVGDGPVEVRLGRRYGALSLGIASFEERRWGLNEVKRRRLIRAGAHVIMPDLIQWKELLTYLHIRHE